MTKHLVIIGAQRSGTTYLYRVLNDHPSVHMARPVRPEPKFFLNKDNIAITYQNYHRKYFSNINGVIWLGEKSTSYLECFDAAISIKQILPDATLIAILRDPVDRAISNYKFSKNSGLEPYGIEQAIREEVSRRHSWRNTEISVNPYAYTERGKYFQYLEHWERLFGRQQMIILVAEQFWGNQKEIAALYEQLDIDPDFLPPNLMMRENAGFDKKTINEQMPHHLKSSLQEKFEPWNHKLKTHYDLDLSYWERK